MYCYDAGSDSWLKARMAFKAARGLGLERGGSRAGQARGRSVSNVGTVLILDYTVPTDTVRCRSLGV